jgi:hypothetical protein
MLLTANRIRSRGAVTIFATPPVASRKPGKEGS